MRHVLALFCLACPALAQSPAGKWNSDLKWFDQDRYERLEITLTGDKLTGKLGDQSFDGTFHNGALEITVHPNHGTLEIKGRLDGDRIIGTGIATDGEQHADLKWEAHRESAPAAPRTHTFEPTVFQHFFTDSIAPVLRINPGDTVKTWSVDAGGSDAKGVRRTSGGNPLTGPFYVESAMPGDTLAVRFTRIRLNRDTAISSPLIVSSALNPGYVERRKRVEGYNSDWKIDRDAGYAMLQKPTDKMKDYRVPLAPMLGCVGVAPGGGMQYRSGFLGSFGGNMDYNQLREGVTVYLPISVPGALLAASATATPCKAPANSPATPSETSMDIEFTVELETNVGAPAPRFEDGDYLMASGIAGSIDEAFRNATTNFATCSTRTLQA